MFVLGHVGLTVGSAALLGRVFPRRLRVAYPFVVLGALLPDLIDKPLGVYLWPEMFGSGRVFGHSLLLVGLLAVAAAVTQRGARPAFAWTAVGCAVHLVLDRLWHEPEALFWPFLGVRSEGVEPDGWIGQMLHLLASDPYVYVSEIAGGLILAALIAGRLLSRVRASDAGQEGPQQLRRRQRAPQR